MQRPVRELKGFDKVSLEPGETGTAKAVLDDRAFSWYSAELGNWYAFPGEYEISAGASSRDIRLTAEVNYETDRRLPVHFDLNSTIGEMIESEKTRPFAKLMAKKMDAFFRFGDSGADITDAIPENSSEAASEAFNEEMAEAMAASQPLRGIVNFGIMTRDELLGELKKYND